MSFRKTRAKGSRKRVSSGVKICLFYLSLLPTFSIIVESMRLGILWDGKAEESVCVYRRERKKEGEEQKERG